MVNAEISFTLRITMCFFFQIDVVHFDIYMCVILNKMDAYIIGTFLGFLAKTE